MGKNALHAICACIFLAVSIVFILLQFVSAFEIESSINYTRAEVRIEKGWNFLLGFYEPSQLNSANIAPHNIGGIYSFDSQSQKYMLVRPNYNSVNFNASYLKNMAFFVYSNKAASAEYIHPKPMPIEELQLYAGWNYLGITEELIGSSLDEVDGSCGIEGAYKWDSSAQEWSVFSADSNFDWDDLMTGIAVSVKNDCHLG